MTRENTIRELAEKQVDQNLDMVKMLNSLGARAAAFTIRDQQLAEMEHRGDAEKVCFGDPHSISTEQAVKLIKSNT